MGEILWKKDTTKPHVKKTSLLVEIRKCSIQSSAVLTQALLKQLKILGVYAKKKVFSYCIHVYIDFEGYL